jgi:hypothetical protein
MHLLSSVSELETTRTCLVHPGRKNDPQINSTRMKKSLLLPVIGLFALGNNALAQCPAGQTQVTVAITTDRYGDETTWTLTGPGGTPVYAQGGPYTLAAANGAYPQTPVNACVPDGTVCIFTINDSYGDGICCAYGSGLYLVTAGATTLATNTNFTGSQEVAYFQTGPQSALDLAGLSIALPSVVAQGNQTLTGTLRNFGSTAISSFTLNYSIDGGAPVAQAINANIAPGAIYNYTHNTPWNATTGSHTVAVWATNLNGSTDGNTANDMVSTSVNVATQTVQRRALMEQFTSSTCPPCASLEANWGVSTFASANPNMPGSNQAAIKYHLNFPSPGNDPSYNPDANTRRTYYAVNGIPNRFMDGVTFNSNTSAALTQAQARPAFMTIQSSYTVTGNTVNASVTVIPYANFAGSHKLFIAVVEDSYNYAASTTTQDVFKYVMRKMMPNGNGITLSNLVAGEPQTFTQSYTFSGPPVAQNGYNLWTNLDNCTLLSFVQNVSTKEVLQADFSNISAPVSVAENELDRTTRVFPNPTNGVLFVDYELPAGETAQVEVFNMVGERVLTTTRSTGNGQQRETLDISSLSDGIYFVNITAGGLRATRKVTLAK